MPMELMHMEAWATAPTAAVPTEDMVLVVDMAVLVLVLLELALVLDMVVVVVIVVARAMGGIIPTEGASICKSFVPNETS